MLLVLRRLLPFFIPVVAVAALSLLWPHASAYAQDIAGNLATVGDATGLVAEDPRLIAARLIRSALLFLGVVAVVIVLYGGWLWMTSGGSEEQVTRAKRVLINGLIGLVIILMSVGIVTFVMGAISKALGGGGGTGGGGNGGGIGLGGGSATRFEVTGVAPTGEVVIRNIRLQITFSAPVDSRSVEGKIHVVSAATAEEVTGELSVQGNRVTFTPAEACPEPHQERKCFAENTSFDVKIDDTIRSTANRALDCGNGKCAAQFTSGEKIDVENPVTTVTQPADGAGVPQDSYVAVQSSVRDDAGVAIAEFFVDEEFLDAVPAEAGNPLSAIMNSLWDSTGRALGDLVVVSSIGYDIAGNTTSDAVRARVRGPWCFNGQIDADKGETGIDCGGDSGADEYCGACAGAACVANEDCGGGAVCDGNRCVLKTRIDGYSPATGAPGTFVTLRGVGFSADARYTFAGEGGKRLNASIASCSLTTATQVTIVVPDGAVPGTVRVEGALGTEETSDAFGPMLPDFVVNGDVRPNLCALRPEGVFTSQSAITYLGDRFGAAQDKSTAVFLPTGAAPNTYSSWSNTEVQATVPTLQNGYYRTALTVDGLSSNELSVRIDRSANQALPRITQIDPSPASPGQYVTISGSGFGSQLGTVWFVRTLDGVKIAAAPKFPAECEVNQWTDGEIATVIPDTLDLGAYTVYVERPDGVASAAVTYDVVAGEPGPNVCALVPNQGLPGDEVRIIGGRFGATPGVVTFTDGRVAEVVSWQDGESVTVRVPQAVLSGPVTVKRADGKMGNGKYFTVGAVDGTENAPRTAAYAWTFSTGSVPQTPAVVHACTDAQISAVPSAQFSGGDAVCLNAVVYAEFTVPMNEGTLDDATVVERCTGNGLNRCGSTEPVEGRYTILPQSVTFTPNAPLMANSLYQVTVTTAATSLDGVALAQDDRWTFTTGAEATACVVSQVTLSKPETVLTEEHESKPIVALPRAGCVALNRDDYTYDWTLPSSISRENSEAVTQQCAGSPSACLFVEALSEGRDDVRAVERSSGVVGKGAVVVNYADPYVTESFPNCTEACRNGLVGARFNVPMDATSLQRHTMLERCSNELCTERTRMQARARCTVNEAGDCMGFTFDYGTLAEGTFYRVTIGSLVTSTSGAPLTKLNSANGYVFSFRTREDASVCRVERIGIQPAEMLAHQVGERVLYTAEAFGAPDSCSVAGQRLESLSYDWSWQNPIADQNNDRNQATRVAGWINQGRLDALSVNGPVNGCTATCLAIGADSSLAVCGDGVVGAGEECEDGNVQAGDGCSAACLREGVLPGATCGDGRVDRTAAGAGEDCDDGNVANGDGCSAQCTNEGSRAVLATCGNNDVAQNAVSKAGEECDDGNAANGDGCSSQCLHEGAPTLVDLNGAVCGNGRREVPFEECDDGNAANGDGCSARCVFEGLPACSKDGAVNCCGNGGNLENFETCDDGNTVNGDGCSNRCLLEGSDAFYTSPSFCGDGVVGVGESASCEVGPRGDSRVDPVQLAAIASTAPAEVDLSTKTAVATVRSSTAGLTGEATLTLQCSAVYDRDCSNPVTLGVGAANCCMARPQVTLLPNGQNVCRNAALVASFDQEMDLDSVLAPGINGRPARFVAILDTSTTGGVCPADHRTALAGPLLAGWWDTVRSLFGIEVAGAAGDCYAPVRSIVQSPTPDGRYAVTLQLAAALAPNARYTLIVEGDDVVRDDVVGGVRALNGAAMAVTTQQAFTTGSTLCGLNEVVLTDPAITPFFFGARDEMHTIGALGYSNVLGVRQQIQPIPNVYDWRMDGWSTDLENTVFRTAPVRGTDTAQVTALGQNGEGTLVASAMITADSNNLSDVDSVEGSADISAFLCENPWPNPALGQAFPWRDSDLNVGVSYCRDAGADGVEDDLPALTVVRSLTSEVPGVISLNGAPAEYLFRLPDTGDAIGLRFFENGTYMPPAAWYAARGFSGSPSETTVNDFSAVRDGRSTYVAVPNLNPGGNLYSNIALLSYNQDTGDDLSAIYEQFLQNITFIRNVRGAALCTDPQGRTKFGADGQAVSCATDAECTSVSGVCGDQKGKVRRDLQRLQDAYAIRSSVEAYVGENGACSQTSDRLCSKNADCPAGESCVGIVPALPSGTFVRGAVSSTWSSWQELLGGALDASLPIDPLNAHVGCGVDPNAAYDATTCVNAADSTYICPANSHAYYYRTTGQRTAELLLDLEYRNGAWSTAVDAPGSPLTVKAGTAGRVGATGFGPLYCTGSRFGAASQCGDGVVGAGEACEPGQVGGLLVACDRNGDGTNDGFRAQRCNASCQFAEDVTAACVAPSCGDGTVNAGEQCDDGVNNGGYGFCGADCQLGTRTYCGDGVVSGAEVCDCGAVGLTAPTLGARRAFGGGLTCVGANGSYAANATQTCAWDCRGPATSCGDGVVNGAEQCDGAAGVGETTYQGKLCSSGASVGQACVQDSDCGNGGRCGLNAADRACTGNLRRTRACATSCTLQPWSACTPPEAHNGIVDAGEACDDGNEVDTDACTNAYTVNVCGDGVLYAGVEQCDVGAQNGQECSAEYGSTCSACSTSCRLVVQSGDYCGDGARNGQEYCDSGDVPLRYVSVANGTVGGTCTVLNQTNPTDQAQVCATVGLCNGGVNNGDYCVVGGANTCGAGGTCVAPQCSATCLSACPVTPQTTNLGLTPNIPNARSASSVALHSYEENGADLPNIATLTIPACRVASGLRADIRTSNIVRPETYVVFVTDRSASMNDPAAAGVSRMSVTVAALRQSIQQLFDELGTNIHVGLVAYSYKSGQGICSATPRRSCDSDADCDVGATCDLSFTGFHDSRDEAAILAHVDSYEPPVGNTFTGAGLNDALAMLNSVQDSTNGQNPPRKIVVLLTDGDANDASDALIASNTIKRSGYELYTIGITSSPSLVTRLNGWSSNGPADWNGATTVANPPLSGPDYSFTGTTADQVQTFYAQIVDSITGFNLTLVGMGGSTTVVGDESGTVTFTLPPTFVCDPARTQSLPIKPVFRGTGTLDIFNVRFDYCPL